MARDQRRLPYPACCKQHCSAPRPAYFLAIQQLSTSARLPQPRSAVVHCASHLFRPSNTCPHVPQSPPPPAGFRRPPGSRRTRGTCPRTRRSRTWRQPPSTLPPWAGAGEAATSNVLLSLLISIVNAGAARLLALLIANIVVGFHGWHAVVGVRFGPRLVLHCYWHHYIYLHADTLC